MLEVLFAHLDEVKALAPEPQAASGLSARLARKAQSRRLADFLLAQLLQKVGLDLALTHHIQRTASGRPFIDHPQLDFNISHSGDWVAVILSYNFAKKAVGIDIEHPQKVRDYPRLLRYYAQGEELQILQKKAKNDPLAELENGADRFYLTWCLREAILKSQGVGIAKLSEVRHLPASKIIYSAHCPAGQLYFFAQLPFYLSYFFAHDGKQSAPNLAQWQAGVIKPINLQPIIYQVNPHE